jgi:Lon protease-like protein
MSDFNIALFPIPGSVALPLSTVPLHVFEPRYRKMIHDCVAEKIRIAVTHTQKVIAESKVSPDAPLSERLNSNQKTYLPYPIFSAGFARIVETLPDGRMLVEIEMDQRYELVEELQSVPYKIVRCRSFEDEVEPPTTHVRQQLDKILVALAAESDAELLQHLKSDQWLSQSDFRYSFMIYRIVKLEPDYLQKVLELKRASERITFLSDLLTRGPLQ